MNNSLGIVLFGKVIILAPCSAPSGFRVSTSTDESLELSWLAPLEIGAAGLDGYRVSLLIGWLDIENGVQYYV